jgi:photosystem II stability/assembly factor-like uncharacterized protein
MRLSRLASGLAIVAVAVAAGTVYFATRPHAPAMSQSLVEPRNMPSKYWFEQRSFPFGTIPTAEWEAAVGQAIADRENGGGLGTSVLSWQFVGPDNIGGRVTAMAVAPGGLLVYMGAANGGVWKSTDGAGSFTPIFDAFSYYSIGALALDPTDPNKLYVGTGESNPAIDTYDGNGIYRTPDGGVSWEHLGLPDVKRIARIAIHPANVNNIFVAGGGTLFQNNNNGGIWRSSDAGQTWSQVLFVDNTTVGIDVIINPLHADSMFAATYDLGNSPVTGSAIWASVDSGLTWTQLGLAQGLFAANDSTDRIALAYAPSRPSYVYARVIAGGAFGAQAYTGRGLWRTTNGGASWLKRNAAGTFTGGFGGFGWYFGDFYVDPLDPERVYALGVPLMRSTDGGNTFANIAGSPTPHVDQHAMWINPVSTGRYLLGNDGGFYRTINNGSIWTKTPSLPISQFYAIEAHPTNVNTPLGGTQDNNTLLCAGTSSTWAAILGGDGFYCAVDPTNASIVFAEFQQCCQGQGPARSSNGGSSFFVSGSFVAADRYNWNSAYTMSPLDHNVLICGSHRIYKSTTNGVSYSIVSGDLAFNPSSSRPNGTISTVDISPVNGNYYFTGSTNGKVYRSTDGGTIWTDITTGLPLRYVTRVVADRFDANTVYATLSGFNMGESIAHVYRSTDLGANWTPMQGDLPAVPVNDIIQDLTNPLRYYVGTDLGVYTTQNGGTTWYPLGHGLPFQAVFDLDLQAGTNTLFAGTHGRSMWKINLNELPVAVEAAARPVDFALSAPSPNPARGTARFSLELAREGAIAVSVHDVMGRRVATIHDGPLTAGRHSFEWDGSGATGRTSPAGIYFIRASGQGVSRTQRLVRSL